MSDPYNSCGSTVLRTTPAATPAGPRVQTDPISRLDVAESWKRRFRLIERAGGPDLPHFRDLPFGDRFALNFNVLAFLLGPFYYLAKGLWRQAVLYFVLAVALIVLLDVLGFGTLSRGVGYGFGALYGLRANISYYKKVVRGETPWL